MAEQFLSDPFRFGDSTLLLAESRGDVAGFCQLYKCLSSVQAATSIILNDLFVAAPYRGSGAGAALVREAMAEARNQGFRSLTLETGSSNDKARRLYERLGWSEDRAMRRYEVALA